VEIHSIKGKNPSQILHDVVEQAQKEPQSNKKREQKEDTISHVQAWGKSLAEVTPEFIRDSMIGFEKMVNDLQEKQTFLNQENDSMKKELHTEKIARLQAEEDGRPQKEMIEKIDKARYRNAGIAITIGGAGIAIIGILALFLYKAHHPDIKYDRPLSP
jgi:hypothetical protein